MARRAQPAALVVFLAAAVLAALALVAPASCAPPLPQPPIGSAYNPYMPPENRPPMHVDNAAEQFAEAAMRCARAEAARVRNAQAGDKKYSTPFLNRLCKQLKDAVRAVNDV